MDEEALILWQDVFDEVAAGRKDNLSCPHCRHQPLQVTENGPVMRIACTSCKEYVEGRFAGYQ